MKIEDYGFVGDLHTGALVGIDGSIDWFCCPRFDSDACMAALLGHSKNGHWRIAPRGNPAHGRQRYRPDTLILETEFAADGARFRVIDFMPPDGHRHDLVRIVEGLEGRAAVEMSLVIRFDYGLTVPWVRRAEGGLRAIAGPSALLLRGEVDTHGEDLTTRARFELAAGERHSFVLTWYPSHREAPEPIDAMHALGQTERFWREWASHCTYRGPWREAVMRSLITLKALTYRPTGGVLAAATTSLPEQLGGVRNWDYRYCWLRDATFTLYALMHAGYTDEAQAWSEWLLRATAGHAGQMQMLYGAAGERSLPERELPHLDGYEASRPVRIGNAAAEQFQLDIYGEVMDALHLKREIGLPIEPDAWELQRHFAEFVAQHWHEPDEGIWEIRGRRRHFTHSKVMAWVALDRAIRGVERFSLAGEVARWREVRDRIHAEVCRRGYDEKRGIFTQAYDSPQLDAALLLMPLVGFLPPADPRVRRTIGAVRQDLIIDGLVHRYDPEQSEHIDGLPPGEGAFLPCSFWMVDCLHLTGRADEGRELFERLLALRSPLGLLAEEYDPKARRLVGNFPQAFSHVALINSAQNLSQRVRPAEERGAGARSSVKADRQPVASHDSPLPANA